MVTTEKVVKWLGFICILAGVSRMGMTPAGLIWGWDSPLELSFGYTASVLMAVCSFAFYLAQSKETGVLGFVTAFIASVGNAVISGQQYGIFAYETYADKGLFVNITGMIVGIGMMAGTILLAFVTFRAKVFPRWNVLLFIIMLVSFGIPFLQDWFAFFWGLAYAGMGYTICTGKYLKKDQPLRDSLPVQKSL
ncbi:hypothetical protein [Paenibacillus sedimenti]|uniref:Uncharacterized protein n=1 Tax=Paenibacillus sedimenti TaxID=2770274 RepID=A0A926KRP6_9BACL|nr:hypothetical protein [Paenibacillus sedimenti]MBD0381053.1 hypothetical protein [Paenibacillus sedimenti]